MPSRGRELDDNRSALREIAKVQTPEGQLNKVQEIVEREAKKPAKRNHVKKAAKTNVDAAEAPAVHLKVRGMMWPLQS